MEVHVCIRVGVGVEGKGRGRARGVGGGNDGVDAHLAERLVQIQIQYDEDQRPSPSPPVLSLLSYDLFPCLAHVDVHSSYAFGVGTLKGHVHDDNQAVHVCKHQGYDPGPEGGALFGIQDLDSLGVKS